MCASANEDSRHFHVHISMIYLFIYLSINKILLPAVYRAIGTTVHPVRVKNRGLTNIPVSYSENVNQGD